MVASKGPKTVFDIVVDLKGNINGAGFTAEGKGVGDPKRGNPAVTLIFSSLPKDTDQLSVFLGVINMFSLTLSREVGRARSFLSLTEGNFGFDRTVQGRGVDIRGTGNVKRTKPSEILLSARIDGTLTVGKVQGVQPWEGVQVPNGKGKVLETMILKAKIRGAKEPLPLYAVTHYILAEAVNLPAVQVRRIELASSKAGNTLKVSFKAAVVPPDWLGSPRSVRSVDRRARR